MGCTGAIGEPGPLDPTPADGGTVMDGGITPPELGPGLDMPLRRLNVVELSAAVDKVFGVTLDEDHRPTPGGRRGDYDRDSSEYTLQANFALEYITMAVWIAREANVEEMLAGCDEDACRREWITAIMVQAFRRPVGDSEVDEYVGRFGAAMERDDAEEGARAVIAHLAASPDFLYAVELGAGVVNAAGRVRLRAEEIATRLALLIWRGPPDEALLERAQSGALDSEGDVRDTVDWMLEDARAARVAHAFHSQWLDLPRTRTVDMRDGADMYGGNLGRRLEDSLRDGMVRVFDSNEAVPELLAGDGVYADEGLAQLMGLELAPGHEDGDFVGGRATGVLLHPAYLAAHSHPTETSPILRGAFTLQRIACATLIVPDIDFSDFPEDDALPTRRERVTQQTAGRTCMGCHERINPIGFALEEYDLLGRHRVEEDGLPIDSTGEFGGVELMGSFSDAEDMATQLASSPAAYDCYLRQWTRFAFANPAADEQPLLLMRLHEHWQEAGGGLRDALVSIATSEHFLTRPQEAL